LSTAPSAASPPFPGALADALMRDPAQLSLKYDSGDHVHLNDAGNQAMAKTIDLTASD
jgi:hypothetical protein